MTEKKALSVIIPSIQHQINLQGVIQHQYAEQEMKLT